MESLGFGGPGRARTCDLLIRSQTLYPTELRVRGGNGKSFVRNGKAPIPISPEIPYGQMSRGRESLLATSCP